MPQLKLELAKCLITLISELIRATDEIWIIGDNFATNTFNQHFLSLTEENSFTRANFDVKTAIYNGYGQDKYNGILIRLRNGLVHAINSFVNLPKIIVYTLENDLIKATVKVPIPKLEDAFNRLFNWLMNESRKCIMTHNENLPMRARRNPHCLWILPTNNVNFDDNERRLICAKSLLNISKLHTNNRALELKQLWDENDVSLFDRDLQKYTANGLLTYWKAVDRTIKFYDFIITKADERKSHSSCKCTAFGF